MKLIAFSARAVRTVIVIEATRAAPSLQNSATLNACPLDDARSRLAELTPPFALAKAIAQRLMLHRDSAVRRRFRCLQPRSQRLLRGAERDNAHATGGRDFSRLFPEGRVSWRVLHTIRLPDLQ